MDSFDFQNALADRSSQREEAEEFVRELKTKKAAVNPGALAAGLGAAIFGAGTYLSNRPGKDGKSYEQKASERKLRATDNSDEFAGGINRATAQYRKELSDVFAKHPGKAGLMGATMGAGIGLGVLKKVLTRR